MLNKTADGRHYYQNADGTYTFYPTGVEGERMANKLKTAQAIVAAVQALAPAADDSVDLVKEFFDVGAFVDADVVALGITSSDLSACITLLQQVAFLMTGQATSPADYSATLNKVRRV